VAWRKWRRQNRRKYGVIAIGASAKIESVTKQSRRGVKAKAGSTSAYLAWRNGVKKKKKTASRR
jgi:hypothetical protein